MPAPDDDVIISPSKSARDPNLPPTGLLFVNPLEASYAANRARKADFISYPLFNSNLFISPPQERPLFICGPAVGAPMAALTIEKLIACGARNIVLMGWCGGLQPWLQVGDIVVPVAAVSEEGTSTHYATGAPLAPATALTARLRHFLQQHGSESRSGPLWSTDAPYRETISKVKRYRNEGVLGVDMEFAALCAVAAFRQISFAAVLLVSDLLSTDAEWKPGYASKTFKQKCRRIIDFLFLFN